MPIHEYVCNRCGHAFEVLTFGGATAPRCSRCDASDLRRKLSTFAAHGGGSRDVSSLAGMSGGGGGCGSCGDPRGPGSCSMD